MVLDILKDENKERTLTLTHKNTMALQNMRTIDPATQTHSRVCE